MGKGNPHRRSTNARNARIPATRTRTRRQKPKLSDPEQNSLDLAHQLRTLGLYPANTIGDGNCLFRALCDQLYGSPKQHLTLRKEICDWLEAHKEHYEGFVEDDRTFAQHVASMRVAGTYGGHLELSAFAHLKRRNVKVIQPGLVYVIEWNTGPPHPEPPAATSTTSAESTDESTIFPSLSPRELRVLKRSKAREAKEAERRKTTDLSSGSSVLATPEVGPDGLPLGAVYVAYHDWEHFSSVRNLTGPHQGIPYVRERQLSDGSRSPSPSLSSSVPQPSNQLRDSPSSSDTAASLPATATDSSSAPSSQVPQTPPDSTTLVNHNIKDTMGFSKGRSPKRLFDETEEGDFASESEYGRAESKRRGGLRSSLLHEASISSQLTTSTTDVSQADLDQTQTESQVDLGHDSNETDSPVDDEDMLDDGLETPLESSTTSSLPDRERSRRSKRSIIPSERLTRQRKKAPSNSKPKPKRVVLLVDKKGASSVKSDTSTWTANGSGKLDVRGFRELKI